MQEPTHYVDGIATAGRDRMMPGKTRSLLLVVGLCLGYTGSAAGMDHVTLRRNGKEVHVDGRVMVTDTDGGVLLLARDGVIWAVPSEELVEHTTDDVPFTSFSPKEISRRMLAKLPAGFDVHATAHYLIFHDTSQDYAQWCGALFERLYRAFTNYWIRKGLKLFEPEFPLVAIVFADKASYMKHSRPEAGDAAEFIVGYFSPNTNRMTMFDLTGLESLRSYYSGRRAKISVILAQPEAQRTVSTIVHEATHQIAFNCGLQTRYSDCPVWFSEGIAVYFETPDLRSTKGWRRFGEVNRSRLMQFYQYAQNRPDDSLQTLIADDRRFHDPKQGLDAYAEAWALTYYLIRQHPQKYIAYVKMLSEKKPLLKDGPEGRLEQFRQIFGDMQQLDAGFLRYMARVR